ncbi:MAG: class I SAM-dependent methyltransferase, partial [Candidatus Nanoarchaeia archaeon]|nr:class I SAM-dependent methyltransferase [Candidatus Nanoarchaeia archaeon]
KMNLRNSLLKKKAIKHGKSDIEAVYSQDFFQENIDVSVEGARKCVNIIYEELKPKKVIDFGCGPGIFIKEFEKKGVEVLGVDGSPAAKEKAVIDKDKIMIKDLREDVTIKGRFDLTICFEVAEHIDNRFSETLVKNVTKNSDKILFTAAKKGQGGTDHINEQDNEFWIELFNKQGFKFEEDITKRLKQKMIEEKVLWWIPENLMYFEKER